MWVRAKATFRAVFLSFEDEELVTEPNVGPPSAKQQNSKAAAAASPATASTTEMSLKVRLRSLMLIKPRTFLPIVVDELPKYLEGGKVHINRWIGRQLLYIYSYKD